MFKQTEWKKLDVERCEVLARNPGGGYRVRHPELRRPRWFNRSRAGNFYSRYTGKETDGLALGYLLSAEPNLLALTWGMRDHG